MERPALEVADIFRAHGAAWRQATRSPEPGTAEGHVRDRALPQRRARRTQLLCRAARSRRSPTTPAATGTARSARAVPLNAGCKLGRPISCRWSTTMWSSRCRHRSAPSPTPTRSASMGYCSTSPPRHCARSPPTQHLGARIGATLVLHTGDRSSLTIRTFMASSGRRHRRGRGSVGSLQAGVLPAGTGALPLLPPPLPRRAPTASSSRRTPACVASLRWCPSSPEQLSVMAGMRSRCARTPWLPAHSLQTFASLAAPAESPPINPMARAHTTPSDARAGVTTSWNE